jgi:hypothetical protein
LAVLGIRPKLHAQAAVLHDDFTNLSIRGHLWAADAKNCARSVLCAPASGFEVKASELVEPS